MSRYRLLLTLIVAFAATQAIAANGVHLYYDDDGQPVYSQFAPDSGTQSRIITPASPPADATGAARQRLRARQQQLEDNREDKEMAAEKTATAEQEKAVQQQRCDAARQNIEMLGGSARRLFQTTDGVRRLTAQERQDRRVAMQKILDTECQN